MLNIVLAVCVCAIIGSIAHSIVGGSGGLLHNAFIGFSGIVLADVICRVFGSPDGIILNILLMIAGACVVVLFLRSLQKRMYDKREE